MSLIEKITKSDYIKIYTNALNIWYKNIEIFLPFALEFAVPWLAGFVFLSTIFGYAGYLLMIGNPPYVPDLHFYPNALASLYYISFISLFIISFFASAGIAMTVEALKGKEITLKDIQKFGKKFWKEETFTLILIMSPILVSSIPIAISFVYPQYVNEIVIFNFTMIFVIFLFFYMAKYIVVIDDVKAMEAVRRSLEFAIKNPLLILYCFGIVLITTIAFSFLNILHPLLFQATMVFFIIPWMNILLICAYYQRTKSKEVS